MAVKHGNWNAYQKTDEEMQREEMERVRNRADAALLCAEKMYDLLNAASLSESQRSAAVEILGVLHRRIER